jgi:gamma-glutamyl-gamma-aminobutyraldehyde dehydrogenase/4-guanidinobutyraldehyde dehydrogenase/NAD-dependent aldehyde dehydrogenase
MREITSLEWRKRAERLEIRTGIFIDGRFLPARSGRTFDCVSPIDGAVIASIAAGAQEDVDDAVRSARRAFEAGRWASERPENRKRKLRRFAELILEHLDELALLETLDVGKPIRDSLSLDIPKSANCVAYYAEAVDKLYDEIGPTGPDNLHLITREPVGVVAAIVAWNYPLYGATFKLGPALAAGNSVVLKPSENSPLTALRVAELAIEAGIPEGVLNVVPGFGETAGRALGLDMDVDCVSFTGSVEVGKLFLRYAGESNMKRVSLECGGKSPNIVLADYPDLDEAAREAATGIFYNAGQVCNAGSRLLVQRAIHDEFVEKVARLAADLRPGDPLDPQTRLGAVVNSSQMGRILDYVRVGAREGARLRLGGTQARAESGGFYVEPTLFEGVSNRMRIAQEEIFGPVLSTIVFDDVEEAVQIANDTIFGLAAGLWTSNLDVAHRVARRLRSGTVWINNYDESGLTSPFGGYKQSGVGRDKSLHAIEKYTELKSTWIKLH